MVEQRIEINPAGGHNFYGHHKSSERQSTILLYLTSFCVTQLYSKCNLINTKKEGQIKDNTPFYNHLIF